MNPMTKVGGTCTCGEPVGHAGNCASQRNTNNDVLSATVSPTLLEALAWYAKFKSETNKLNKEAAYGVFIGRMDAAVALANLVAARDAPSRQGW